MKNLKLPLFQLIPVFTALLYFNGFYAESRPHQKISKQNTLFVFGDSLFDPGNNLYLNATDGLQALPNPLAKWPYGETYFKHPTGRVSDGRIVPDFIALFAKLPILGPYLQPVPHRFTDGVNFASAGAGVLDGTSTNVGGVIPLRKQLAYLKKVEKSLRKQLGNREAKNVLGRAVYLFSIGGNDYFSFSSNNPNATIAQQTKHVQNVIGNLTTVIKEIYSLGGRKIAFQNAGPLGCLPLIKDMYPILGDKCAEAPSVLARRHNRYLAVVLKKLESTLPGFKYSIFDYYNSLSDRINNPSKYGLKEGKAACCGTGTYRGNGCGGGRNGTTSFQVCGNPGEYLWFDGGHTTESANYQLAQLLWSGKGGVTGPYNMKQLFQL